jgi:hypothetical protein
VIKLGHLPLNNLNAGLGLLHFSDDLGHVPDGFLAMRDEINPLNNLDLRNFNHLLLVKIVGTFLTISWCSRSTRYATVPFPRVVTLPPITCDMMTCLSVSVYVAVFVFYVSVSLSVRLSRFMCIAGN